MSKSPGPGADSFRDRKRVRLQALRQMAVTSSPTSMSSMCRARAGVGLITYGVRMDRTLMDRILTYR